MDRLPLSVCIIARDEEQHIESCLASVASIAAQIVLCDTGSTDRTVAIAERYGAAIYRTEWQDDFAAARNESLRHARQPWILVLDADERLCTPDAVRTALATADTTVGGFFVTIASISTAGSSSPTQYQTQVVRLFRNDERLRYEGIIHEQILPSLRRAGYRCVPTAIMVEHVGYNLDPQRMHAKQRRNLDLLNRALEQEPESAFYRFHRAKTLMALGDNTAATADIEIALRTAHRDSILLPQILNYAALLAVHAGCYEKALSYAQQSATILPQQPMSWFLIGEMYRIQGDAHGALQAYTRALQALETNDPLVGMVGTLVVPRDEIELRRGRAADALGQTAIAEACYRRALEINPGNLSVHQLLEKRMQHSSSPKRPLLSLAMIVRNEAHTLARCLESVRDVVDQMVIVDTGSTDGTIALAKAYGAEVYHFAWCDDFAAARNEALRHACGEWILYLDADEVLAPDSAGMLRHLLYQQPLQVGGLLCTIVSPHRVGEDASEVHRGAYPRLFRNYGYPRIAFRGRVHEQITPAIIECGGAIVHSPIVIYHSGYNIPREQLEEKVRRNYRLLIRHVQEEPLNGYAWFQLGQTLARMQLFSEAEQAFRFALQMQLSAPLHASAANALAYVCGVQGRYQEALTWAEESLCIVPDQNLALHYKAHALLALNRFEEACAAFEQLLTRLDTDQHDLSVGFEIEIDRRAIEQKLKIAQQQASTPTMNLA